MRTRSLLVLALLAGTGSASAQYVDKVKPFPYQGFTATYPSGMRLVAFELPYMPEVMISASYRVGSVDDPPGKEGLAHLIEHLTFRARPGGAGPRTWDRYDALGVEFNALTFADSTEYYAICASAELEQVLTLEAERLRAPLAGLTERDFLLEREVVLRELAQRRDPAATTTHLEWLTEMLVPGSPYARVPTEESVRSITLDDVRSFVQQHYTPAHLLLVVTGQRKGPAVSRTTFGIFGELAAGEGPDVKPVGIAPPKVALSKAPGALEVHEAPVERPVLWVAWAVPGDEQRTLPRALMAERFLENAIGYVGAQHGNRRKMRSVQTLVDNADGVTLVAARIELRNAEDAAGLFSDIRAARNFRSGVGGVDPFEGIGVRTELLMGAHLSLDALEQVGIASFIRSTGKVDYIGEWPRLVAVTLSDDDGMKAFMAEHARSDRLAGLLVVPSDQASPVPTTGVHGTTDVTGLDHHSVAEPEIGPGDPAKVSPPPELARVLRKKMGNGAELVLAPRSGFRAVSLGAYARTDPGSMAQDTLRWMALWTAECAYGATVNDASVSFEFRKPTDLVPDAIRRFPCPSIKPQLDGHAFDVFRREWRSYLEEFPPSRRERASAAFLGGLFPGHPYGDVLVTPAHLDALASGDVSNWIKRAIRPEQTTVVASGDLVGSKEEVEYFEDRFGRFKAAGEPLKVDLAPPALPAARKLLLSNRPGWTTAEVLVGVRAPPRANRDEPAFRALTWRLSHDLNARLRISRAMTYGVSVRLVERSLASAVLLQTVVPADKVPGVVAELLGNAEGLVEPVDPATLAKARWQVARQFTFGFGTTERNRDRLAELALNGLPPDEWNTFLPRTVSLTPERITAQASTLGLGHEVVLVVGDAAVLAPALKARGLEVEVLPDGPEAPKR